MNERNGGMRRRVETQWGNATGKKRRWEEAKRSRLTRGNKESRKNKNNEGKAEEEEKGL